MRRALRATWPPALVLVALVGAWEAYVDAGGGSGDLPSPHAIASSIWNDRSLIWSNFKPTAEAMLLGVLLAALIGVALSISMHLLPWLRRSPMKRRCSWSTGSLMPPNTKRAPRYGK